MAKHLSYYWLVLTYPVSIQVSGGVDHRHLEKIVGVHLYHNLVTVRTEWKLSTNRSYMQSNCSFQLNITDSQLI